MAWSLNELGNQLFAWLEPLSIELAALALLVLAAGRLIRSPALRHLLWLSVLVKPLIAIAVSSPYTVFAPLTPLAEPGWDPIAPGRVEHLAALAPAGAPTAPSSATLTPAGWAAILWLVGTTLLAGRILVGFGILRRMRRQALVQREGPLFEALRQARAALGCHPGVDVATSPSIRSPMVLGILKPLILVPADLLDRLPADQLTLVLMHELAHVRRCDNLALLLQRLVSAALFFHPALWLCGRMLRRESELACDDLVVYATGRPEAYARGLTLVAESAAHSNLPARRIPMMSTFASTESDLSQRIRRTLNGRARRMDVRARLLAVVLLCPLAVVTLPSYGAAGIGAGGEAAAAGAASVSTSADETQQEERVTDHEERKGGPVERKPDSTGEEPLEAMETHIREAVERRIREVTDSGEPAPKVLLQVLNSPSIIRKLAEAGLKCQDCPHAKGGTTHGDLENLFLVVHQDGSVTLNQEPVTLSTLQEELQSERQLLDNNRIIIQHDERASGGQITGVIDIVQQAGLAMLGYPVIATEQGHRVLQEALAADPSAWSEELKAGLLEVQPESTIEAIAALVRERRGWLQGIPTDPGRSPDVPVRSTSDGTTVIPYEIATAASVELVISNVAGRPVRTFDLGRQNPGEHCVVWDRRDDEGRELDRGLYFCLFKTDAGERWQKKALVP